MQTGTTIMKQEKLKRSNLLKEMKKYKFFYILVLPGLLYYLVFSYFPMYGITLAFKEFLYNKGIGGSPWIGLQNFNHLFQDRDFLTAFKNTLMISGGKILICFPIPIILALLLNEIRSKRAKGIYQTIFTFPHFISWIIVSGITINILSDAGILNQIITSLGGQKLAILMDSKHFRWVLYGTQIWKEAGWDSIIYLAALAGINPDQYEAAEIDGANRFHKILYISWPGIKSTVAILLILAVGFAMNANFDQIFNLYSPVVYKTADIIDTYVYRTAFSISADFSYATAVGLFKSIVNLVLIVGANMVVKRGFKEQGLI